MFYNKILTIILLFITSICECKKELDIECGTYICFNGNGECMQNLFNADCKCSEFFDSFPKNETIKCNYERKKQIVAFLLETFFTYGAGHFYLENYQFAIPKLFFWVITYCLFIYLKMIIKSNEENQTTALIITLLACLFLTIMFAWQITDMVLFGLNIYNDGYGINLLPWGAPKTE